MGWREIESAAEMHGAPHQPGSMGAAGVLPTPVGCTAVRDGRQISLRRPSGGSITSILPSSSSRQP